MARKTGLASPLNYGPAPFRPLGKTATPVKYTLPCPNGKKASPPQKKGK
jgi:hypothetical protein